MKKDKKHINLKSLLMTTLSAFLLASCTKEIPEKAVDPDVKQDVANKSLFDTQAEYLYSASQQNSSRSAAEAFPYSSGDNKRVKVQILEHSLRIMEMERDNRYSANDTNNKIVLEIPIEHVQFQCVKDRFGECTNTEGNATEIPWEQRNSIKLKFDGFKSGQIDMLPILDSESCYKEVSNRIVKSDITSDALNFQVERTFDRFRPKCAGQFHQSVPVNFI